MSPQDRVVALAELVLESPQAARDWLSRPQIGLGGEMPLCMLKTPEGARAVELLLQRIEHGVLP